MPKTPVDYSKTVIYKIVCNNLEIKDCYVGATVNFTVRKHKHKSDCHNEKSTGYNQKVYQFIRLHGGWVNWSMIEIEQYPCTSSLESKKRERFWLETLNASLNFEIPSRPHAELQRTPKYKEYYKNYGVLNKDKISEYQKEWWHKNKDEVKEKRKKYAQANIEKIREQKRKYRELHALELKEKAKMYWILNKKKI